MIVVTGTVTAIPETFDRIRELSLAHVRASRAEPGCISHAVSIDCEDAMKFVFFEEWESREILMTHFRAASAATLIPALRELKAVTTGPTIYEIVTPASAERGA